MCFDFGSDSGQKLASNNKGLGKRMVRYCIEGPSDMWAASYEKVPHVLSHCLFIFFFKSVSYQKKDGLLLV